MGFFHIKKFTKKKVNNIFGKCPSQEEIDAYINKFFEIYLYFTDTQIDPLNYKKQIQRGI